MHPWFQLWPVLVGVRKVVLGRHKRIINDWFRPHRVFILGIAATFMAVDATLSSSLSIKLPNWMPALLLQVQYPHVALTSSSRKSSEVCFSLALVYLWVLAVNWWLQLEPNRGIRHFWLYWRYKHTRQLIHRLLLYYLFKPYWIACHLLNVRVRQWP